VLKEMDSLLLDEPRLAADRLAALLSSRGQQDKADNANPQSESRKPKKSRMPKDV